MIEIISLQRRWRGVRLSGAIGEIAIVLMKCRSGGGYLFSAKPASNRNG
ncbi:MAG: hypothetical protein ABI356_12050 [Steroidobacteraceae bacterium]